MKIDFNKTLLDTELEPSHYEDTKDPIKASDILRRNLLQSLQTNETDITKFFDWGMELKKSGVLDLDKSDQSKLSKFIMDLKIPLIYKGQILNIIEDAKAEIKKN